MNSLSPALTAVTAVRAVASFASFARCFKLLAAKPQFHFNVNITEIFDSISKGQFIVASLLQLLPALQALPDVLSCWQLNLNFILMSTSLRYLIPSTKVNSLSLQQGRQSVSESVSE